MQVLSYAGCSTCKRALKWLAARGLEAEVRPIVERPPTVAELAQWIPASGLPIHKWLNTSGQSYRAMGGKAKFDGASEPEIMRWLSQDGKLVKRPVLVDGTRILVGFNENAWEEWARARG